MKPLDTFEVFDISPEIHSGLAVFPGDTRFSHGISMDMRRGDSLTLSQIQTTVHLGAHADAPNHYFKSGDSIERRNLKLYMGAAQVISVDLPQKSRVEPRHIQHTSIQAPRVLFRTGSYPNPDHWNDDFSSLSREMIHFLHEQGVRLVGIDTPSIDLSDDKVLESHQAVAQYDMAILEGLVLKSVAPGLYQLIALPLRLRGAEASPVRAVLLKN